MEQKTVIAELEEWLTEAVNDAAEMATKHNFDSVVCAQYFQLVNVRHALMEVRIRHLLREQSPISHTTEIVEFETDDARDIYGKSELDDERTVKSIVQEFDDYLKAAERARIAVPVSHVRAMWQKLDIEGHLP